MKQIADLSVVTVRSPISRITVSSSAMAGRFRCLQPPLLEQVTDEIIGMEALHDDDDRPFRLVVEARSSVLEYHCFSESRRFRDCASCGLSGSSMMMKLPPRPVRVPPTEVARRDPPAVVMTSVSVSFAGLIRVAGNTAGKSECIRARQSLACLRANVLSS